jgi:EAL domain-containing protein (putative c-di-GMP-specific phosphodiesterase class I)
MCLFQSAQQIARERRLQAFFQPILELKGEVLSLRAYEGFAHGQDDTFLGSAGLMYSDNLSPADHALLDVACLTQVLKAASELPAQAQICLNVHLTTLSMLPEFPAFLADSSAEAGIPLSRLVLELNVQSAFGQGTEHLEVLDDLRPKGVGLALDNFGVGEANLDLLLDLRPDILKVSPGLTFGLLRDTRRQAILEGLVEMARKLGSRVLVKNLETVEDLRIARWMGVNLLQGYLLGMPGPLSVWREGASEQEWQLRSFMRSPAGRPVLTSPGTVQ